MKKNGFTLVELALVLVMVGAMLGVVITKIDVERSRQDAAIQSVTLSLNAAQRKAALRQHDMVVAVDQSNMRFRIHSDTNNDGVMDAGEDVRWLVLEEGIVLGRGGAPAHPAIGSSSIEHTDTQEGLPSVTFHRNGSASSFMGFYTTALSGAGSEYTRALGIVRATGEVTCYSYRTGSWEAEC